MTEKNKWLGGTLSCLIAVQFVFGIYLVVWTAVRPSKFFDSYPRSRVDSRPLPAQQLPAIPLDPFRFCISQSWRLGELVFLNIAVAFGASPTPDVVSPRMCLRVSQFRRSRVLEYLDRSQETQASKVSRHPEPFGYTSAGRDDVLYTHGPVSNFIRCVYFVHPGKSPPMVGD